MKAADHYSATSDLWVVTSYYNPAGYHTKRLNYERFRAPLIAAGIPLVTIECAFGNEPFELEPAKNVLQVRGRDVMWMKERLINLAIQQLPPCVEKVAWIDNDILFCNPDWAVQTAAVLDHFPVAQPCDRLHRLESGQTSYEGSGYLRRSFAERWQNRPELAFLRGGDHGFPGGAWAARRSLIEKHGLYDAAILDGGDELFSHALVGDFNGYCVRSITGFNPQMYPRLASRLLGWFSRLPWPRRLAAWYIQTARARSLQPQPEHHLYAHYANWADKIFAAAAGRVGCVPGLALHLWHGDPLNRQYNTRTHILKQHGFDPATDLKPNKAGVWEWASQKPALHQAVSEYFFARREDG